MMDIQAEKIELMKLLLNTNNPSIIESVKQILKKEKSSDFWDELDTEQKQEIEKAELEIKVGETKNYESFISSHR